MHPLVGFQLAWEDKGLVAGLAVEDPLAKSLEVEKRRPHCWRVENRSSKEGEFKLLVSSSPFGDCTLKHCYSHTRSS